MFSVQDKFIFEFNMDDKPDFIKQDDLLDFSILEQGGNIPPVFSLMFTTDDDEIPLYINEGIELRMFLGQNLNNKENFSLVYQNSESWKIGSGKHLVIATGCHNSLDYFDTKIEITDKMTAPNALNLIGGRHYIMDNELDLSGIDSMYWKRPNISSKKFINDIWLATYLNESFPVIGITAEGKMLVKDVKKVIQRPVNWSLIDSSADNYIPIAPDYKVFSRKGFFNAWLGVIREKFVYDLDDSIGIILKEDVKAFLSLTAKIGVKADRESKRFENGVMNENVHDFYWRAYLRNLTSLAMYSAITLRFNFLNTYLPLKLYDTVFFKEYSTTGRSASEYNTGNYIITKRLQRYQKRTLVTLVDACRESFNQPVGNLR